MKKYSIVFALALTTPLLLTAQETSFTECTTSADERYEIEGRRLENDHEIELSTFDMKRGQTMKSTFNIFKLRNSLQKIQESRTLYKVKVAEADIVFKRKLAELKAEHESKLQTCDLEKKELGDNKITE